MRHFKRSRLACLLRLLVLSATGSASAEEWTFQRLDRPEALADVRISDVAEDPAGNIWAATWGAGLIGLAELDSEIYRAPEGMPSDWTYSVVATADGSVWCGGPDGIARVRGGSVTSYTKSSTPAFPEEIVWCLSVLNNGHVAAGIGGGYILRIDPTDPAGIWEVLSTPEDTTPNDVRGIKQTRDGTLWAACGPGGLWRLQGGVWEKIQDPALHPTNAQSLFTDQTGRLYVTTHSKISCLNEGQWFALPSPPGLIQCVAESPSGELYCGTDMGLYVHEPMRGWQPVNLGRNVGQPLVKAIIFDVRGNMWLACYEGVIQGQPPLWHQHLASAEGFSFLPTAFTASKEAEPYAFDVRGNLLRLLEGEWSPLAHYPGLTPKQLLLSKVDPTCLWVLTEVAVLKIDLTQQQIIGRYPFPLQNEVDYLFETKAGQLLKVSLTGIYELRDDAWQLLPSNDPELRTGRFTGIAQGSDRSLYMCTEGEALHWEDGRYVRLRDRFPQLTGVHFLSVAVTRSGDVWFATSGEGVFILRGENLIRYRRGDGLPSDRISTVFEASDGTIWVSTRRAGVSALQHGRWIHYGPSHGLPNSHAHSFFETPDGAIWFTTDDSGFFRYATAPGTPSTFILNAPDQIAYRRTGMVWLDGRDAWNRTPREELAFSWRFVPVADASEDTGWTPFSFESVAVISPRAPGRYLFESRAADMDRNVDPTPASMLISITPPLWRTPGFLIPTALLTLIALGALGAWFRVFQAEKRAKKALEVTAASLEHAQRLARIGNWEWDVQSGALKWSAEVYRITGLQPEQRELDTGDFLQAVHPEDRVLVDEMFERAVSAHLPMNFDHRILRKDGNTRYVHEQAELVLDAEERVVRVFGTVADITERKLNEQERDRLIADLQKALADVRTLSGLVPICANCKNIRDDKGYWQQIETYVRDRSHAEFSHSICPDCAEALYGDRSIGEHR